MNLRVTTCISFNSLRQKLQFTKTKYALVFVNEIPDIANSDTIYFIGNVRKQQYVIFNCPCGCGRIVELNLNLNSSPCWRIQWHLSGKVSLSPSVWRKNGCHSHFILKKNDIIWC